MEVRNAGANLPLKMEYFSIDPISGAQENIPDATIRADLVFEDGTIVRGDEEGGIGYFEWQEANQHYKLGWTTDKAYADPPQSVGVRYVVEKPNLVDPDFPVDRLLIIDLAPNLVDPDFPVDRLLIIDLAINSTPLAMPGPDGQLCAIDDVNPDWPCDDTLVTVKVSFE
jgi:hypothetical protein